MMFPSFSFHIPEISCSFSGSHFTDNGMEIFSRLGWGLGWVWLEVWSKT